MTPDALHAVASKVEREWGSYGYRFVRIEPAQGGGGCVCEVLASDGATFWVASDRYGNTSHGDTRVLALEALRAGASL